MTQAQFRRLAIVEAVVVAAIAAIFLISSAAGSDGQGRLTEEFHKVYPLSAQGRVEIANINGRSISRAGTAMKSKWMR